MEESKEELEAKVSAAMHARLNDFKEQADSLTLEGVRRVLEKDLGLKTLALDTHKKFVKQWMEKHFYGPTESDIVKSSEVNMGGAIKSEGGEKKRKPGSHWHPDSEEENKRVDDLSLGEKETMKKDSRTTQDDGISEEKIKKAIKKRATYFRENSENITMSGVRRLLEEDLELAKNSLDTYKALIKKQLDEVLSAEDEKPMNGAKTGKSKKSTPVKGKATPTKMNKRKKEQASESSEDQSASEASSGSMDSEEEEKTTSRKKASRDLKEKTRPLKKQKISAKESRFAGPGKKPAETKESSDTENEVNTSDDNRSSSSADESSKKPREKPTPVYGKKVEHLKSVIKSCGMSVPPSIYKKAKDAPESKREAVLIKELEGILEREGLSTNPSEKEIKALKKRKERAKELEGIDMSNIVSSSRRRTASSYVAPKPQIPIESDEDEGDDEEDDTDVENSDENTDSGVSSEGSEEDAEEESD